uniref:DUF4939 domain-containing protein n=1 Tax=Naja naja TaxID=35670 RepID=A0A8C6XSL1_NAJNA
MAPAVVEETGKGQRPVAQMQGARPHRKCPVAVPDKFDGSLVQFPAFFGQCQLYMSLRPEDFPTDWDKVGFLISLLSGSAACWAISDGCDDGGSPYLFPAGWHP